MLDLSPTAADVVQRLHQRRGSEGRAGVRLSRSASGSLAMTLADGPQPGDVTLFRCAVAVYLDDYALSRTQRHVLDGASSSDGDRLFLRDLASDLARRDRETVAALRAHVESS